MATSSVHDALSFKLKHVTLFNECLASIAICMPDCGETFSVVRVVVHTKWMMFVFRPEMLGR